LFPQLWKIRAPPPPTFTLRSGALPAECNPDGGNIRRIANQLEALMLNPRPLKTRGEETKEREGEIEGEGGVGEGEMWQR